MKTIDSILPSFLRVLLGSVFQESKSLSRHILFAILVLMKTEANLSLLLDAVYIVGNGRGGDGSILTEGGGRQNDRMRPVPNHNRLAHETASRQVN